MGRQPNERSEVRLVDQISASWNRIVHWLRQINDLHRSCVIATASATDKRGSPDRLARLEVSRTERTNPTGE